MRLQLINAITCSKGKSVGGNSELQALKSSGQLDSILAA